MGTPIVRFAEPNGEVGWGVLSDDRIGVLNQRYDSHHAVIRDYFADPQSFQQSIDRTLACKDVNVLAPVTRDIQIFCQGLNYASHREEGGISRKASAEQGQNLIFSKPASSICGPYADVIRPANCQLLDYEIELALLLKRDLPPNTAVTEQNLLDYVGGITIANDISARDLMFGAPMMQWFKGKGQRTFCPTGPVLYLIDPHETALLDSLHLTLRLNGEIRQQACTDQLIFKPHETLTELAAFTDLKLGDLLLTGTPGGVILNASAKVGLAIMLNLTNDQRRQKKLVNTQKHVRYLQPGDQLELTIHNDNHSVSLGTQRNTVIDAG